MGAVGAGFANLLTLVKAYHTRGEDSPTAIKKKVVVRNRKKKVARKSGPTKHRNVEKPRMIEPETLPAEPLLDAERLVVTLESIGGETVIGDLLVAFPWTRDVLVKKGLRLEAEDAGDIYMSLEAFSAMNSVSVSNLVEEVVVVAREPPPQHSIPPLVAAPAAT